MAGLRTPLAVALLIGFVVVVAGFVYLTSLGDDATALVSSLVVLLTGVGIVGHQQKTAVEQKAKLDTITEQTNGVLDARIGAAVESAVAAALQDVAAPAPAPAHATPTSSPAVPSPPALVAPAPSPEPPNPTEGAQ